MVEPKYVAGAIIGLGGIAAAVLLMSKYVAARPYTPPVGPQPPPYQPKTDAQRCAEKGWKWVGGKCVEPDTGVHQGTGKDDNDGSADDNMGPQSYECCTGGGTVSNPKDCPGGNVKPNCPQQEIRCPETWTMNAAKKPVHIASRTVPAGTDCGAKDCKFPNDFPKVPIYAKSDGNCPGGNLRKQTEDLLSKKMPSWKTNNEVWLDPGACPGSIDRASNAGGLPQVRIHGPICVKKVREDRKLVIGWGGGRECKGYSKKSEDILCISPGTYQTIRPPTTSKPAVGSPGRMSRIKLYLVPLWRCSCYEEE